MRIRELDWLVIVWGFWHFHLFFFSLQLVLPEYLIHFFFCVMFFCAAEWLTLCLNLPLLAYHVWRWVSDRERGTPSLLMIIFSLSPSAIPQQTVQSDSIHCSYLTVVQVYEQACDELSRTLRPDNHHERWHPGVLSKRRLVQTGFLSPVVLLLSLWVRFYFYILFLCTKN